MCLQYALSLPTCKRTKPRTKRPDTQCRGMSCKAQKKDKEGPSNDYAVFLPMHALVDSWSTSYDKTLEPQGTDC